MTNLWIIYDNDRNNVYDFDAYGAYILKGSYAELLAPPMPRKRLEHEYLDQSGITVDTLSPLTFEPRRFTIKIAIKANSDTQFWQRYNGFFAIIAIPGPFILEIADLNKSYHLLYEGCSKVEKLTRITGSTAVYATFEIKLLQPNP
jgi:hypothetical protein